SAVLVGLADQAGLDPRAVAAVLRAVARGGGDAYVAAYSDAPEVPGHPVALGAALWPAVDEMEGDVGARTILRRLGTRLVSVPLPGSWRPVDCDTPADYASLLAAGV
ncbi:MAG TPA: NTP transferase domain-containing protein, partial [Candidatus Dormibacteraeota bacterium]|nr:NTP transferase domain-containing protein [Candidatus Dormibacteraeota bacterium]